MTGKQTTGTFIANILILILEVLGIALSLDMGTGMFVYYTQDSNIFCGIVSIILLINLSKHLKDENYELPEWLKLLRLTATCVVTLTFLVVIFILAPGYGMRFFSYYLFGGSMLYCHTLAPLAAIITYIFIEKSPVCGVKKLALTVVPTFVYGVIAVFMNLTRKWFGPYPFLHVYRMPWYMSVIWYVAILGGAFCIAVLLNFLSKKAADRK